MFNQTNVFLASWHREPFLTAGIDFSVDSCHFAETKITSVVVTIVERELFCGLPNSEQFFVLPFVCPSTVEDPQKTQ